MKNKILLLIGILFFNLSWSQIPYLSKEAKISVLSCGPGSELYSKFGHSAIRVKDPVNKMDIVYNYGVFDFTQPNFYLNFAKGRLDYMLVRHRTADFINQYRQEQRSVIEQVLNLNSEEQNKLLLFLENNAKPENRTYSYHFFFNNCATKIIDVIALANPTIIFEDEFVNNNKSFRSLIDSNLNENSWGSLGINIALGSKIDQLATDYQHRFLPKYVALQLEHSLIDNKPLISKENQLLKSATIDNSTFSLSSPLVIFSLIFTLTILLVFKFKSYKYWKLLLYSVASLIGVGILFLWLFTNHDMTQYNYNILWANPLLILLLGSKRISPIISKWIYYIIITGLLLIPIIAISGLQSFNFTLYPLMTSLFILVIISFKNNKRA